MPRYQNISLSGACCSTLHRPTIRDSLRTEGVLTTAEQSVSLIAVSSLASEWSANRNWGFSIRGYHQNRTTDTLRRERVNSVNNDQKNYFRRPHNRNVIGSALFSVVSIVTVPLGRGF
jgi:hypothetical protein